MISVVVPVYNIEQYICICVESILKQTYKDFELILVDDGSPDDCPYICDQYAERYENVRVLHKENGGLSDARNAGTNFAKGNYITYIDGDDYVSDDYLEILWGLLEKYRAEIAVTGIRKFFEEGSVFGLKGETQEFCYTGIEALEHMLYQQTIDTSACAMLLPIDIAKKNPFPYKKFHEDEFTTYKYYISVNKVAVTTRPQYFYLQRGNSIMHIFGQASLDELDAADNLVMVCEKDYPNITAAARSKKFSDYCQVLLAYKNIKNEYPETYKRIIDYVYSVKLSILFDKNTRIKNKIAAISLLGGYSFLKYINRWKYKIGCLI